MMKTLALIKRHPEVDRSAFREHYETIHVPLALPLLEGLCRYVRYHVETERVGRVGFDVLTAFWYRDEKATEKVFQKVSGPEGAALREDERSFMDTEANRFFAVSERHGLLRPSPSIGESPQSAESPSSADSLSRDESDEDLFVLVARPEGMSRFDCSTKLVRDHWPRLLARLDRPGFVLLRDAFAMVGGELPYDAVLQVQAASFAGLESWARSVEAEGFRVEAVLTRRFETPLASGNALAGERSPA